MKISLVVASGVHKGKSIPVNGVEFVIGRDEGCQLRPASPAVSKRHCAITVRNGKLLLVDFGSTNGTFVNDVQVQGEAELKQGDRVKIGPLDFSIAIGSLSDSTPLPEALKTVPGKGQQTGSSAAVKKVGASSGAVSKPAPAPPKPSSASTQTPATMPAAETKPHDAMTSSPAPKKKPAGAEDDDAAAMLLGMSDDDEPVDVPDGSTVMDLPAVGGANPAKPDEKKPEEKKVASETSSSAAASLLSKYMRRPNK